MSGNSRTVQSSQPGSHPDLERVVRRHLSRPWQGPVAAHTRAAFDLAENWRARQGSQRPLVLDSGCGTGRSTLVLAERWPQSLVIGLDQSADRLQRGGRRFEQVPDNLLWLRAEAGDFWRLAVAAGWRLAHHALWFPNPWPKPGHLRRRWHGHPAWAELLRLGGQLELRTNWPIYAEEMALALACSGHRAETAAYTAQPPFLTDFEEKYQLSGHQLWQLTADLDAASVEDFEHLPVRDVGFQEDAAGH